MDERDYLIDEQSTSLIEVSGRTRVSPSELRGHPLHVETVELHVPTSTELPDSFAADLRTHLLDRYGFAPRAIFVASHGTASWSLVVHGETVETGVIESGDQAEALLTLACSRHLFRMITTDDVVELLTFAQLQDPVTIDHVVPNKVSVERLLGVLRRLLRERVPIKPLARILEVLGAASPHSASVEDLAEHVRVARARTIVQTYIGDDGRIPVLQLADEAEAACVTLAGLRADEEPARCRRIVERFAEELDQLSRAHGAAPVIVACRQHARPLVARALRRTGSEVIVIGSQELDHARVRILGVLGSGIRMIAPPPPPPSQVMWSSAATIDPSDEWNTSDDVIDVDVL